MMLGLSDQADESRIHMMVQREERLNPVNAAMINFRQKRVIVRASDRLRICISDYLPNAKLSHPERGWELAGE